MQRTPSASDEAERDFRVDGNEAPLGVAIRSRAWFEGNSPSVKMEERGVGISRTVIEVLYARLLELVDTTRLYLRTQTNFSKDCSFFL